jgi:signal peptidase I
MKRKNSLTSLQKEELKTTLVALQQEILNRHRKKAYELAKEAESLARLYLKKSSFTSTRDFVFALFFALIVAIIIRQVWFEFYEIPTGSMRPTLKEQDRLVVSKTDFGINIPLTTGHFYFDPALVQRGGIFIFTVENMDVDDSDTVYFYLFPGKKQYIKRLIGKPGDILYFYGGRVYGIDQDGKDISSELQNAQIASIDHIPFIHFEGKVTVAENQLGRGGSVTPTTILSQMNEPVAKLYLGPNHQLEGEMLPLNPVRDTALPPVQHYEDLWGIKNYATARLLTKDEVKQLTHQSSAEIETGMLYLELKHNPSLRSVKLGRDLYGRMRPMLNLSTAIIALNETQLHAIFNNLYTARFIVKNGFASRYGMQQAITNAHFQPHLPGVPDGTYEFYNGKAYQIKWQGIAKELPPSHPLYTFSPERAQLLFNLGIEMDTRFAAGPNSRQLDTSRYAYYRDGDLYLMNAPIIKKDDPNMVSFLAKETSKQSSANSQNPYIPFKDFGPPLKADGTLDTDKIRQFGIKIPSKMYLALGDNYAMSADSRVFGFVPEQNIRGAPTMIFWPPGSRFGAPNQPSYPFMNLPRAIVWSLAAICIGSWVVIHHRRNKLPLKF